MLTDGLAPGQLEVEDVVRFVRSLEYAYDCTITFAARLRYDSEGDSAFVLAFTAARPADHGLVRFNCETTVRLVKDDPHQLLIVAHNLVELLGHILSDGIPEARA